MSNQPWMIFHPEGTLAYYLWNGKHPILIHVDPKEEGTEDDHVWGGNKDKFTPLTDLEIRILNEAASTTRKSVFVLNKRRYNICKKGEFT